MLLVLLYAQVLNEILKFETIIVSITILSLAATVLLVFVFHTTQPLLHLFYT